MAFDPTGNGSVTLRVCFAKSTLVVKLQTEFVDLEFNGAPALRCGSCGGASAVDDGGGSSAAEACTEDLPCVQRAIGVLLENPRKKMALSTVLFLVCWRGKRRRYALSLLIHLPFI